VSLREGLLLAREGETSHPAVVAVFGRLASEHGTPLYVYDAETIREQARSLGIDAIYSAIRGRRSLISRIGPLP